MVRFWFAVVTDIICIGIVGGYAVAKNGMAIVDAQFYLFLFICLIACFPLTYMFFVGLDRFSSSKDKANDNNTGQ